MVVEYLKKSAQFLKDMVSSDLFRTTTFYSAVAILALDFAASYYAGGAFFHVPKLQTLWATGQMALGLGFSTFSAKRAWDHYFPPAVVAPVAPPADHRASEESAENRGPFPSIAKGSTNPIHYHYHIHRNGDEEGEEVSNFQAPQATRGRATRAQSPATKRRSSSRLRGKKDH